MEGEKATEAVDAMHGNLSYTMGDLNYTNLVCFMGVSFSAVAYWFNLKALEKVSERKHTIIQIR